MGTVDQNTASLQLRLRQVSARIEQLKIWSDAQLQVLQTQLNTQIAELQIEIAKLQSESPAPGTTDYAARIEAQLQELSAKGDAVYDLLRGTAAGTSDRTFRPESPEAHQGPPRE